MKEFGEVLYILSFFAFMLLIIMIAFVLFVTEGNINWHKIAGFAIFIIIIYLLGRVIEHTNE